MKRCLIAMSGGVDSAAVACLLKEKGYEIAGATMKLLNNEETKKSIEDAKAVCNTLKIKHYVFDLEKEFKEEVIKYFIETYQAGKTPNPCIVCNKHFKFGYFYEEAQKLGYSLIATGHYAKIMNGALYQSNNLEKDQSYFLYSIPKEILNHILFPLAEFKTKEEVRAITQKANLAISRKKDSEDICFIPNGDYKDFVKANIKDIVQGDICLKEGKILGKHQGLEFYTIGQRKGLGISHPSALYVTQIDKENNKLIVGENKDLFHNSLVAKEINLLVDFLPKNLKAKVRSRASLEKVALEQLENNKIKVIFERKQRAITQGQSIVFYLNGQCLGGGIIDEID